MFTWLVLFTGVTTLVLPCRAGGNWFHVLLLVTLLFAATLATMVAGFQNASLVLQSWGLILIWLVLRPRDAKQLERAILYAFWWFALWHFQFVHGDFRAYLTGAERLAKGEAPWGIGQPYLYPPFFAQVLLFADRLLFMVGVADSAAGTLWLYRTGQWVAIVCVCESLAKFVPFRVAFLLPLVVEPFWSTLWHTQVTLWVLALMLGAVHATSLVGGLLASFAIHLKLYGVVILAIWLLVARWMHLLWGILLSLGLGVVSFFLISDAPLWWQWLQQTGGLLGQRGGLRLPGLYTLLSWLGHGELFEIARAVLVGVVGVLAAANEYRWRKVAFLPPEERSFRHLAVWLAVATLCSPFAWHHVYVLLLPLLALLLSAFPIHPWKWFVVIAVAFPAGDVDYAPLSLARTLGALVGIVGLYLGWLPHPRPLARAVLHHALEYLRQPVRQESDSVSSARSEGAKALVGSSGESTE